jgi:oligopeptide transport system permease protein
VAIGAVSWLDIARIVRGQTLALKSREFIEAARVSGVGTAAMIVRHLVPNLIGIVVIYATLTIPTVILFEAFLSFLGTGRAIADDLARLPGRRGRRSHAILSAPAAGTRVLLAAMIFCFNFLGDGLRDALDPRER